MAYIIIASQLNKHTKLGHKVTVVTNDTHDREPIAVHAGAIIPKIKGGYMAEMWAGLEVPGTVVEFDDAARVLAAIEAASNPSRNIAAATGAYIITVGMYVDWADVTKDDLKNWLARS